jgi:hypothetical protein
MQSTVEPPLLSSRLLRFVATDKTDNNRMSELFDLVIFDPHGNWFSPGDFISERFFMETRRTDVVQCASCYNWL